MGGMPSPDGGIPGGGIRGIIPGISPGGGKRGGGTPGTNDPGGGIPGLLKQKMLLRWLSNELNTLCSFQLLDS